ncbi:hypothetical protein B0T17DRAFT_464697, partial [Bombardia bombarda]
MKWQTLTLGFFATTGLASPINTEARDVAAQNLYSLRLSSSTRSLDGKYLGVNGTLVGVYKKSTALRFYPVTNKETSMVELHTYPVGVVDHALALIGSESQGLLDLSDVVNPDSFTTPKGTKCDWKSFHLASSGDSVNTLTYGGAGKNGRWVAFPSGNGAEWTVKWKDSNAMTLQTYMPVAIVYEAV